MDNQIYKILSDLGVFFLWNVGIGLIGVIVGYVCEGLMIDVVVELIDLIQIQCVYLLNVKIIMMVDEMLQEIMNIKC